MKIKISNRGRAMFEHFAQCQDKARLPEIPLAENGFTALEVFCHHESHGGELLPCREPELLSRALNGKEWNGLTVTMVAEDLLSGLAFVPEVRSSYPPTVAKAIFSRARQLALQTIGFVPTFLETI